MNDEPGSAELGVSGDELGEGSAFRGESKVDELVVVGDDSSDPEVEATDEILPRRQ